MVWRSQENKLKCGMLQKGKPETKFSLNFFLVASCVFGGYGDWKRKKEGARNITFQRKN